MARASVGWVGRSYPNSLILSGALRGASGSGDVLNGGDDVDVGGAAAQVAAHPLTDFGLFELGSFGADIGGHRARPAGIDLGKHRHARTDLARRAVPALEPVTFDERLLQRMQAPPSGHSLDGGDGVALGGDGEDKAGIRPAAVEQHRACPALPVVATLLRPGQVEMLPKGVEQGGPVVELEFVPMPVDGQTDPARGGNPVGHTSSV